MLFLSDVHRRYSNTERFLFTLSSRLSGRQDCKGVEYVVSIGDVITIFPYICVFPDTYHRRRTDKRSIIDYIRDILDLSSQDLVRGVYKYQLSDSTRKRRWTKVG